MKSTRRSTIKLPRYAGTYHGVHKWYIAMFEKLGWMLLAKAKGNHSKVAEYKKSVDRMIRTMEHIKSEYEDHNKIHDLNVLLMNSRVLQEYIKNL